MAEDQAKRAERLKLWAEQRLVELRRSDLRIEVTEPAGGDLGLQIKIIQKATGVFGAVPDTDGFDELAAQTAALFDERVREIPLSDL